MSKRRVLGFVLLASSVGVAVACGPQNRMSWSNNPALQPQFSNLGVHGGKIGGAVLVTENGNPVSIAAHQGIVIETRGADGVWRKASWIVTPTPTGTNPDNTPTPTGTDPDSTPTATPSGTATATATATPTATDTNPTPTPTGTCGDTPTPTPTASGTATATPTPGAPVPVDAAIVADDSGSVADHADEIRADIKDLGHTLLDGSGTTRLGLVRVSSGSTKLIGITDSLSDFENAADGLLATHGWTALWDGVRMGNEELDIAPMTVDSEGMPSRYKAIVVFTDGQENNSSDQHQTGQDDGVDTTYDDLLHLQAQGVNTAIWTVGVGDSIDEAKLMDLAAQTGGQYLHIADYTELPAALGAASMQMHSVALTGFTPASCDATEARITVHTAHGTTQMIVPIPPTCH